jgi:DNA gyrase subunit B
MGKDQDIKILTDVEHVLKRPGMYIGSTRPEKFSFWVPTKDGKLAKEEVEYIPGQYKLFCEVLDNSLDEHIRGFCSHIKIAVDKDNGVYSIEDDGRGIPIEIHKEAKVPTPQVVFTQLRSGSNFDDTDRLTVGMNGVGASLATIFSEKLIVQVHRDDKLYQQAFTNNLSKIGPPSITSDKKSKTGTIVKFKPDPNIFSIGIPEVLIHKRCLELSYMFPKLKISLKIVSKIDECFGCNETTVYHGTKFENFVKMFDTEFSIYEDSKSGMKMAVAYNKHTEQFEHFSNVNGADTFRGGSHIDCVKELFCEDFKDKIKKEFKLEVTNIDVSKQLIIVLFQNWNAPQFEGQTKEKFVNDKTVVKKFYDDIFSSRRLTSMISEVPGIKQAIVDDVTAKLERKELKDLKDKQKGIDRKKIAKLIEASGRDRSKCAIYITEGDSAISNLATVRDSKTMAGLPLRGKIMNVHEESSKDVLENKEVQAIMAAVGLKIGDSPLEIRSGKVERCDLNYSKIIIATDQDMDGYSIRCLLINFFFKFWPEIIQNGYVYILETPLYEVMDKKTEACNYFYNKAEYEAFMSGKTSSKYEVSYFKGLGSCGKEAWDYMINSNPNLIQVTAKDVKQSSEKLKMAFGDNPEVRKQWLST